MPRLIVIVGTGRLGRSLAARLSRLGDSVVVVDQDEVRLGRLPAEFTGFKVHGDASEMQTLRRARIDEADVVFAVTAKDSLNLMVAQAARELFGVERVRARVSDPSRETLYARLGVLTVNPNALAVEACLDGLGGGNGS